MSNGSSNHTATGTAPQDRRSRNYVPPPPDIEPVSDEDQTAPVVRTVTGVDHFIRAVHLASRVSGVMAAAMFFVAMLIICQLVFMRYILNASTVWQTEAVVYLMIGATLIGLSYVQLLRGHVNVDLLPMYLKRGPRKILASSTLICGLVVSGIFTVYGTEMVIEAYDGGWNSPTIWAVALWKPYSALPIGFGLLFLQFFADLLGLLTARTKAFHLDDSPV
ncbi:TRAP transporter small permease [Thalassospira sp.]|uniref:TRAP transporter small permease n=1 Tax=Thalassospira sp. TaxID=1912094 RepID=UPI00273575A8|nr:TRAP transporter small permease [Thalassospira sp.]MDP2696833.1 TRAP transporter small permease [Thalassospira sp.]